MRVDFIGAKAKVYISSKVSLSALPVSDYVCLTVFVHINDGTYFKGITERRNNNVT